MSAVTDVLLSNTYGMSIFSLICPRLGPFSTSFCAPPWLISAVISKGMNYTIHVHGIETVP